jgi:hypothetical protein
LPRAEVKAYHFDEVVRIGDDKARPPLARDLAATKCGRRREPVNYAVRVVDSVLYFPIPELHNAPARAQSLGGTCIVDPTDAPMSRIAVFTASDGDRVGLVQPLPATTTPG